MVIFIFPLNRFEELVYIMFGESRFVIFLTVFSRMLIVNIINVFCP